MPGFSVHHQLPELTQTHVHRVSDAIQPSHPLSSPSPLTFNLSLHLGIKRPKFQTLALPFISCVTLMKSLNIYVVVSFCHNDAV